LLLHFLWSSLHVKTLPQYLVILGWPMALMWLVVEAHRKLSMQG
jgi:hypothetical protein